MSGEFVKKPISMFASVWLWLSRIFVLFGYIFGLMFLIADQWTGSQFSIVNLLRTITGSLMQVGFYMYLLFISPFNLNMKFDAIKKEISRFHVIPLWIIALLVPLNFGPPTVFSQALPAWIDEMAFEGFVALLWFWLCCNPRVNPFWPLTIQTEILKNKENPVAS